MLNAQCGEVAGSPDEVMGIFSEDVLIFLTETDGKTLQKLLGELPRLVKEASTSYPKFRDLVR